MSGLEFEDRIRINEAGNTKFNFLKPNDPYHAYYRHKITEIQEGVAQEAAAAASQQAQVCVLTWCVHVREWAPVALFLYGVTLYRETPHFR